MATLIERGIAEQAGALGWKVYREGWAYMTYTEAGEPFTWSDGRKISRWKAFNSAAKPKYEWYPGRKPEAGETPETHPYPPYYLPPGTIEAIKETGTVYIVSGEPDLLTLRAAGADNVICWFGENNVPETLAGDLARWGAKAVEVWPDRDDTGTRGAVKIRERLYDAGFEVTFYALPEDLGDGGDLNKLWVKTGFNQNAFWSTLLSCPPFQFPKLSEDKKQFKELPRGFLDALDAEMIRRGANRQGANGYSNDIPCPVVTHEHDSLQRNQGAFAYNPKLHIGTCQKCGRTYLSKDLGAAVGLNWQDFIEAPAPRSARSRVTPQRRNVEIVTFRQVVNEVRQFLKGEKPFNAGTPLPMPYEDIKSMGGFASLLLPSKMMAVVGGSGTGKTTFIETMLDAWYHEYSGVFWGPEWSRYEYLFRAAQRLGGPHVMAMVMHLLAGKGRVQLAQDVIDRSLQILDYFDSMKGELYFIPEPHLTGADLREVLDPFMAASIKAGNPLSFVALDYIQMMDGEESEVNIHLNDVKKTIVEYNIVGVVGSQITKADSRAAAQGESTSGEAMLNARDNAFNLTATIARKRDENGRREIVTLDLEDGFGPRKFSPATVRIAKNSLGAEGPVKMYMDLRYQRWITQPMPQGGIR